jgi:hypothetical protein
MSGYLTTEEMAKVEQVFQQCFLTSIARLDTDVNAAPIVKAFLLKQSLQYHPYMLFSKDNMTVVSIEIFSSPEIREMIMTLAFIFYGKIGNDIEFHERLINTLTSSIESYEDVESLVPVEIKNRMPSVGEARKMLKANKWAAVLIMYHLFVTYDIKPVSKT